MTNFIGETIIVMKCTETITADVQNLTFEHDYKMQRASTTA